MADDTRRRRVATELQRLLNELLHSQIKDPRLEGVTVSEVEMSGDLGVAKVFYATLDPDEDPREVQAGFKQAAGFVRGRVGQVLRLRRTPELHFIRDESARRGAELTRLIDELGGGRAPSSDSDDSGERAPSSDSDDSGERAPSSDSDDSGEH